MYHKIETKSSYKNALLLQATFKDIVRGARRDGVTLLDVSELIKNHREKPVFAKYSAKVINKYLIIALRGGVFVDRSGNEFEVEPLMEDYTEVMKQKRAGFKHFLALKDKTGQVDWANDEKDFVIDLYRKGYGPKKICDLYSLEKTFNPRTHGAIEFFLGEMRKKGIVKKLSVDWQGDAGFFALWLFARYGKDDKYLVRNAKALDDYFFNGNGMVTRTRLNNFYSKSKVARSMDLSCAKVIPFREPIKEEEIPEDLTLDYFLSLEN